MSSKKSNVINTIGKRKLSKARATIRKGTGVVRINGKLLDSYDNEFWVMKIKEPLELSDGFYKKFDFSISVNGGGAISQAEAIRMSIARGLVEASKGDELKNKFIAYDRNMLVYDPRRNEPSKPSRSSDGARRKKQLSKR